jgi:hypothetical protein
VEAEKLLVVLAAAFDAGALRAAEIVEEYKNRNFA